MPRPKKEIEVSVVDKTPDPIPVPVSAPFNEREVLLERQLELQGLRNAMATEGVDSISKLDVMLSQVNERIRQLG